MDGRRFDELAKTLASSTSRRTILKAALGSAVAALAVPFIGRTTGARQQTCQSDGDCPVSFRCCTGVCRDVPNDVNHCGGCDAPCPAGASIICCDGLCADAATSRNHCGACDNSCGDDLCVDGACCTAAAFCAGACCAGGEACLAPARSGDKGICCPVRQVCGTTCCTSGSECVDDPDLGQVCCPTRRICNVGADRTRILCCDAETVCLPGVACCPSPQVCGEVCCADGEVCSNGACVSTESLGTPRAVCVPRRRSRNARRSFTSSMAQDASGICSLDADCCEEGDVCDGGECRATDAEGGGAVAAGDFGCCKCSGTARGCMDVQSQAACDTLCGTAIGIFSTKHTCKMGGSGTTNQCRLKTGLELDEPCEKDDEVCTEETGLSTSPVTASALDLAARTDDGWALQAATACFDGDACRAGGLFGAVPGDEVERLAARLVDGYRHRTARRTAVPEAPSDTIEHLFFRFSQPSEAAEFEANIRGLVPPDAIDRIDEVQREGVSFAFSYTESSAETPDRIDERLLVGLRREDLVLYTVYGITEPSAVDLLGISFPFDSVDRVARNLDLEFLVSSAFFLAGPAARPEAEQAVTVLDGQSLPIDGESADQLDFRLLTDVGTIHALRLTQTVNATIGPVSVVREVRELESEEAAISFVADSQGRVQAYFGEPLTTFTVTEFDGLGDQGTGFIYFLSQASGGFVGGVTGYTRLGTYVGVVNVNVRGNVPSTPDQLALIQDGRYFANPGVGFQRAQIERWIGLGAPRSIPVPAGLLGQ